MREDGRLIAPSDPRFRANSHSLTRRRRNTPRPRAVRAHPPYHINAHTPSTTAPHHTLTTTNASSSARPQDVGRLDGRVGRQPRRKGAPGREQPLPPWCVRWQGGVRLRSGTHSTRRCRCCCAPHAHTTRAFPHTHNARSFARPIRQALVACRHVEVSMASWRCPPGV